MDYGGGNVIQTNENLIAELPMLTAPKEKEELIIYLAAAKEAISAVLMTERNGKQVPIYFVSRALHGPEINYTPMEKLILALILSNPKVTGRLLKWSFELEEHDIHYRPRTSVKGQILADFIVEHPEDDPPDTPIEDKEELSDPWILFIDGSSCIDGSGAGLILMNPEGAEFTYALRFRFDATNNKAEYEALIAGIRIAEQMGVKNLQANVDSRLMANQVNGSYIAKEPGMIKYLEKVGALTSTFKEFSIKQVPRGENKKADAISKMASTSFAHLKKQVLVEELKEKSIDEKEVLAMQRRDPRLWFKSSKIRVTRRNKDTADARKMIGTAIQPGVTACAKEPDYKKREFPRLTVYNYGTINKSSNWRNTTLTNIRNGSGEPSIDAASLENSKVDMIKNEVRVRNTSFKPGDLVYRNNEASHAEDGGKLGPKWEGPYEVTEALGKDVTSPRHTGTTTANMERLQT
ncbi:reverse transcriptase domain-containing protein [Tanacetum coccineum]|uniref:Reverse transcriptase domain-containing protein n=1 Tax=Tanacetum coccineum TaxID=301880 RepID=A0ABQ4WK86_9ASTR